ncbi:MAG TPA: hypothetical protein VEG39_15925, partial [Clostridia bacterium]|nr:hypothetical protein [Clostridia bacterium]
MQKAKVLIMDFILGSNPPVGECGISYEFLFQQSNLLVKKLEKAYTIPDSEELTYLEGRFAGRLYIGSLDGHSCYTARYPEGVTIPEGFEFLG